MTDLLEQARSLLDEASTGTVSAWPRAATLLARQELEAALDSFWVDHEPALQWQNMRVQLACLQVYAPELAADASWVWHSLTRATHHHPYELDPTREELATLIERTQLVATRLRGGAEHRGAAMIYPIVEQDEPKGSSET